MEGGEWHNFEPIAKLEGTLIFLMGVKNLHKIVGGLVKNGKSIDTPVAIIERGATEKQRVTLGTFNNIVDVALARDVKSPAIIVIGDVVKFREYFKWFEQEEGKRNKVLVTRDSVQAPDFVRKLENGGMETKVFPLLEIEGCLESLDEEKLKEYKALLFNSPNGVRFFMEKIKDLRVLAGIKIGTVGSKTKEVLENFKIVPDFVPEKYLVSELAEISTKYTEEGDKILVVTSDISPCDEEKWNKSYKREYHRLVAYRTKKIKRKREELLKILEDIKYVTFLSSSTVESFWENLEGDLRGTEECKFVSIGPVTSETMKKYGMRVDLEAKNYDTQGIVDIIRSDFNVFENEKN
jgi:uroporphyrinogen III methyltransferase/synthase